MNEPRVHYRSKLFRLPLLRRYSAIVLGSHIFVKGESLSPALMRHEQVHLEQVKRFGLVGFYLRYLFAYARLLVKHRSHHAAYWNIPFEVEARKAESKVT